MNKIAITLATVIVTAIFALLLFPQARLPRWFPFWKPVRVLGSFTTQQIDSVTPILPQRTYKIPPEKRAISQFLILQVQMPLASLGSALESKLRLDGDTLSPIAVKFQMGDSVLTVHEQLQLQQHVDFTDQYLVSYPAQYKPDTPVAVSLLFVIPKAPASEPQPVYSLGEDFIPFALP